LSTRADNAELREVSGEELADSHYRVVAEASLSEGRSREEIEELLPTQTEKQFLTLFEDGEPAATGATIPMTQNVRGKLFAMGGVSGVATRTAHRRRGYAREVMLGLLEGMYERGEAVSTLYPFRDSFYGRLGYASFPQARLVRLSPQALVPLLGWEIPGEVDLVRIRDGFEEYREFLKEVQPQRHGMSLRPPKNASQMRQSNRHWLAVARSGGEVSGVMTYRPTDDGRELTVSGFFYRDSLGKYLLLRWLARHTDQANAIWLYLGPGEFPETWLDDLEVEVHTRRTRDERLDPMGRVVLVEGLSGMHTGEGRFTAHLTDEHCPWNEGSYAFETVDGKLEVSRAEKHEETHDCELDIRALSALVFTGHGPGDFALRGWGEPVPEAQRAMRSMFPPALPYLHEEF